jgi:hypothetical protein
MVKVFKSSDIVRFCVVNNQYTEEGLSLGGITKEPHEIGIYEKIDLESFPSSNDFKGEKTIIKHGEWCIVLKKIGRPHRVNQESIFWSKYDVYEILLSSTKICQVFSGLLEHVEWNHLSN